FQHDAAQIAKCEFYLLEDMEFYTIVYHPYKTLVALVEDTKLGTSFLQAAWFVVNDCYKCWMPLLYPPHMLALAAMFVASSLVEDSARVEPVLREWFVRVNVNMEKILIMAQEILDLYQVLGEYGEDLIPKIDAWTTPDHHYLSRCRHSPSTASSSRPGAWATTSTPPPPVAAPRRRGPAPATVAPSSDLQASGLSSAPLLASTDPPDFRALLESTVVAAASGRHQPPTRSAQARMSQSELVNRVIEILVQRGAPNVMTKGYRKLYSMGARPVVGTTSVENYFPNTTVSYLKSGAWELLLTKIGPNAMMHLLLNTSVFVLVPNGCYFQTAETLLTSSLRDTRPFSEVRVGQSPEPSFLACRPNVFYFVKAFLSNVLPRDLWGSADNEQAFLKALKYMVNMNRFNSVSLSFFLANFKPMHLLASFPNAVSPTSSAHSPVSPTLPPRWPTQGRLPAQARSLEPTVLADLAAVLLSLLFGFAVTLLTFCWNAALGGRPNRSLATLHSAAAQYKIPSPGAPLAAVGSSSRAFSCFPAAVDPPNFFRAESGHTLADVRTALRRSSQVMARLYAALDTVTADLHVTRRAAAAVSSSATVSSSAADAVAARSVPLHAAAEAAARIADALEVGVLQTLES
ncbi:hypothetical protein HK405_006587, partial [Cladochytrium tenue]